MTRGRGDDETEELIELKPNETIRLNYGYIPEDDSLMKQTLAETGKAVTT